MAKFEEIKDRKKIDAVEALFENLVLSYFFSRKKMLDLLLCTLPIYRFFMSGTNLVLVMYSEKENPSKTNPIHPLLADIYN